MSPKLQLLSMVAELTDTEAQRVLVLISTSTTAEQPTSQRIDAAAARKRRIESNGRKSLQGGF